MASTRHYELMVILAPDLEERTIAPSLEQYLTVIRNAGGNVEKVDVWGRRRLSYEINKSFEGIYAILDLHTDPDAVSELDRQLNLNESVLRTKVMRIPERLRDRGTKRSKSDASPKSDSSSNTGAAPVAAATA